MARQENNANQAWANFQASGSVADYLKYRRLEDRASAVTGTSGGTEHAKRDPDAARRGAEGKRPPNHGAF